MSHTEHHHLCAEGRAGPSHWIVWCLHRLSEVTQADSRVMRGETETSLGALDRVNTHYRRTCFVHFKFQRFTSSSKALKSHTAPGRCSTPIFIRMYTVMLNMLLEGFSMSWNIFRLGSHWYRSQQGSGVCLCSSFQGRIGGRIFAWIWPWSGAKDTQDPCAIRSAATAEVCESALLGPGQCLIPCKFLCIKFALVWT